MSFARRRTDTVGYGAGVAVPRRARSPRPVDHLPPPQRPHRDASACACWQRRPPTQPPPRRRSRPPLPRLAGPRLAAARCGALARRAFAGAAAPPPPRAGADHCPRARAAGAARGRGAGGGRRPRRGLCRWGLCAAAAVAPLGRGVGSGAATSRRPARRPPRVPTGVCRGADGRGARGCAAARWASPPSLGRGGGRPVACGGAIAGLPCYRLPLVGVAAAACR